MKFLNYKSPNFLQNPKIITKIKTEISLSSFKHTKTLGPRRSLPSSSSLASHRQKERNRTFVGQKKSARPNLCEVSGAPTCNDLHTFKKRKEFLVDACLSLAANRDDCLVALLQGTLFCFVNK